MLDFFSYMHYNYIQYYLQESAPINITNLPFFNTTWGDKLKEKIERFSKGDFDYKLPYIYLSEESVELL